jgi:two-component system sensor histidine kinase KdpD
MTDHLADRGKPVPDMLQPPPQPVEPAPKQVFAGVAGYLISLGFVAAALVIGLFLQKMHVGPSNVGFVFLTAVLMGAIRYGRWPALVAAVVSALSYNFFFFAPFYTFTIDEPGSVVTVLFFGLVAVVTGDLAARVRAQAVVARERAAMTENLYLFSRKLAAVFTLDDLLWAAAFQFAQMLQVRSVILLPDGDAIAVRAGYPPEDTLDDADLAAARWAWRHGAPAGRGTDCVPVARRLFLPMRTGRGTIGVVGLDSDQPGPLLSPDQRRLFDALADQAALAIERTNLAGEIERQRLTAETERLRAALLTSISHDLRTPLASILGSATTLRSYGKTMDPAAQDELMGTIQEEAERLNRFISNLLDMTRLESGAIKPRVELVDLADVVGSALRRAGPVLAKHRVEVTLTPDLPMLKLDPVLFEQVLFNLLDNAGKYAPQGTRIFVQARRADNVVRLEIADEGRGIPAADRERVFDKFYRVHAADRKGAGTGLGLAICRGFVEAMGGTITADNRRDAPGAVLTVMLPVPPQSPAPLEAP